MLRGFPEAGHLSLQHRSASSSRLSLDFPDLHGKPAYTLKPGQPSPGQHSLLRPPFAVTPSTGILTCFPSTTPFGLALGSTHPAPINVGQEPLVFRRAGFSPALSLLMSAFALLIPPATLTGHLQAYRTLPYPTTHKRRCRSFGAWFSPVTSSAQADSTSELLRFL